MSDSRVCFYSQHAQALSTDVQRKIGMILEQKAMVYDRNAKCFYCNPIFRNGKPYNKTRYELVKDKTLGIWACNCQGFVMKKKKYLRDPIVNLMPTCAHQSALYECFSQKIHFDPFDGAEYRQETLMETMRMEAGL